MQPGEIAWGNTREATPPGCPQVADIRARLYVSAPRGTTAQLAGVVGVG